MAEEMDMWRLMTRLLGDSEDLRQATREHLEQMGLAAVPVLVRVIECDWISEDALSFARRMLAEVKPRYEGEIPDALIEAALATENMDAYHAASQALVNFGAAATAPLLALLTQGGIRIYSSFASALAQIARVDPSVIPAVIHAMEIENWNVRAAAAQVLLEAEPRSMEAIAPLIRSLHEEDHRFQIIHTLEWFGAMAIPALLESLRSPDSRIRAGSAEALGMIEVGRKVRSDREPYPDMGVVPALVVALGDESVEVLRAAGEALGMIGPPEVNPAAPVFLNILRMRDPLRFPAAASKMGWVPFSEPGLETDLIDALADRDAGIRAAAADLFRKLASADKGRPLPGQAPVPPDRPLTALLRALDDEVDEVRFQAARALAEIAPGVSGHAVRMLHSVLVQAPNRQRAEEAMWALGAYGPAAAEAVPALIDALHDYWRADGAARVLARIGPLSSAATPALLQALGSTDENTRYAAAEALAAIGPEASSAAVNVLLDQLCRPDEFNRCCAAEALAEIGQPAANVAIPALQDLMTDENKCTRYHVAWALKSLGCDVPTD